ncbi:MAG: 50S ribosomal protein L11 methyltransferase [Acetobacter sp.]|nr:50S ribosomal protein L11 methyltransferase [Acetobacter sp.]
MHNHSESCKLVRFAPLAEMPEIEAEFLSETFDVVAVNYTDDGLEEYVCYAPLTFKKTEFDALVKSRALNLPSYTIEILESKNWLTENVIKFAPFEISDFMIYGIHEASCPKTDKIPVQVYAATAFGSEHQTTKMCLTAISELHKFIPTPKRILDMGTGSGILSIAAAKRWNKTPFIIAADIDPESVDVTHSNTITNNTEQNITSLLSDGYNNPLIKNHAPYNLIFANILLNPLKEMCNEAYNALAYGGYYLISGFIENQADEAINHHLNQGFKLIKLYQDENWRAALLQK